MFLYPSLTTRRLTDGFFASVGTPADWVLVEFSQWEELAGDRRAGGQRTVKVPFLPFPPAQCSISAGIVAVSLCKFRIYTRPLLQDCSSLNSANSTFSPHYYLSPKCMNSFLLWLISGCPTFLFAPLTLYTQSLYQSFFNAPSEVVPVFCGDHNWHSWGMVVGFILCVSWGGGILKCTFYVLLITENG